MSGFGSTHDTDIMMILQTKPSVDLNRLGFGILPHA